MQGIELLVFYKMLALRLVIGLHSLIFLAGSLVD